jgi:transposase-like protein
MPQALLPLFPSDLTTITPTVGFQQKDGQVVYFQGVMPFFTHAAGDHASFQMIAAQMAVLGLATQAEIVRAFGISTISLKRWVKRFRAHGAKGFFETPRRRGPGVLTEETVAALQKGLDEGQAPAALAEALDLRPDTVRKAIREGRLHQPEKKLRP